MCEFESGFGFESGLRGFSAGFGFRFRLKKHESGFVFGKKVMNSSPDSKPITNLLEYKSRLVGFGFKFKEKGVDWDSREKGWIRIRDVQISTSLVLGVGCDTRGDHLY